MRGEQVEKAQLDAARSLFAFRPAVPPAEGAGRDGEGRPGKINDYADVRSLCACDSRSSVVTARWTTLPRLPGAPLRRASI